VKTTRSSPLVNYVLKQSLNAFGRVLEEIGVALALSKSECSCFEVFFDSLAGSDQSATAIGLSGISFGAIRKPQV
jgi:hypothetical protein